MFNPPSQPILRCFRKRVFRFPGGVLHTSFFLPGRPSDFAPTQRPPARKPAASRAHTSFEPPIVRARLKTTSPGARPAEQVPEPRTRPSPRTPRRHGQRTATGHKRRADGRRGGPPEENDAEENDTSREGRGSRTRALLSLSLNLERSHSVSPAAVCGHACARAQLGAEPIRCSVCSPCSARKR